MSKFASEDRELDFADANDEEMMREDGLFYRRAVTRQNRCFGCMTCIVMVLAAVYVIMGMAIDPNFTLGGEASNEFDQASGEVGLSANNGKSEDALDKEQEDVSGAENPLLHKEALQNWLEEHAHDENNPFMKNPNFGKGNPKEKPWIYNRTKWLANLEKNKDKYHFYTNMTDPKFKPYDPKYSGGLNPTTHEKMDLEQLDRIKQGMTGNLTKIKDFLNGLQANEKLPESKEQITMSMGKRFTVVREMTHETSAFTEGLTFGNGKLFESTGLKKQSRVQELDPSTGMVIRKKAMDSNLFGEGLTFVPVENRLYQLTYKARKGFVYSASTFELVKTFDFTSTTNEGWGLTYRAKTHELVMSDGSPYLHFWRVSNPGIESRPKLKITRQNGRPAKNINELEYYKGRILANVWYQDVILVINPDTGEVEREYDFSSLWPKQERRMAGADVLNGIAISESLETLYFTGKNWKKMFEVKLDGMN
eukprot:CAMPEP_0118676700 /NCGR_PEP_ID=MMETSP0800-20121206/2196_1 /TAXON_ID=210618 ORGANISM="Striatella unipunctata, Strain CCMP2910" /NCGR_SAMPLE_ID=MMETSP0800 /ASSEMBLY_ACC=CAM_ASM_000638 /LENGTH=478 /DNA_ID=CAMNT_0006572249 /DNA_START=88 /DNA_END=1525 /DNA_ORIENTATION=+